MTSPGLRSATRAITARSPPCTESVTGADQPVPAKVRATTKAPAAPVARLTTMGDGHAATLPTRSIVAPTGR